MTFQNCPPQVKESEPCYCTWVHGLVIVCMLNPRQKEISLARWIFFNRKQLSEQVLGYSTMPTTLICTGKSKPLKTKRGSGFGPIVSINCSPFPTHNVQIYFLTYSCPVFLASVIDEISGHFLQSFTEKRICNWEKLIDSYSFQQNVASFLGLGTSVRK